MPRGQDRSSLDAAAAPRSPARLAARLIHPFEVEDAVLAAWLIGLEALVLGGLGVGPVLRADVVGQNPPVAYALGALWLFLLFTRGPEDHDLDTAIQRRMLITGPFFVLLSIYGGLVDHVRRGWGRVRGPSRWPAPYASSAVRRTAAVPIGLLGESLFREDAQRFVSNLASDDALMALFEVVAVAAVFVLVVVGPRVAAGATRDPRPWLARFAMAVAAAWTGSRIGF